MVIVLRAVLETHKSMASSTKLLVEWVVSGNRGPLVEPTKNGARDSHANISSSSGGASEIRRKLNWSDFPTYSCPVSS